MSEPRNFIVPCSHCGGDGSVVEMNGEFLRKLRESKGLSLRNVARRVGISAPYLSDIENGRRKADAQFGRIERAIQRVK